MGTQTKEQQVQAYLEGLGLAMTATLVKDGGPRGASTWALIITRNGRSMAVPSYTMGAAHRVKVGKFFTFGGGFKKSEDGQPFALPHEMTAYEAWMADPSNSRPAEPTMADVFYCLASDASLVRHGQTFKEWCAELGYDTDSRNAEQSFNICRDNWAGLVRLGLDLDALDSELEGY